MRVHQFTHKQRPGRRARLQAGHRQRQQICSAAAAACTECSRRGQQRNVCAGMTDFLAVRRTRHSPARARALISDE